MPWPSTSATASTSRRGSEHCRRCRRQRPRGAGADARTRTFVQLCHALAPSHVLHMSFRTKPDVSSTARATVQVRLGAHRAPGDLQRWHGRCGPRVLRTAGRGAPPECYLSQCSVLAKRMHGLAGFGIHARRVCAHTRPPTRPPHPHPSRSAAGDAACVHVATRHRNQALH